MPSVHTVKKNLHCGQHKNRDTNFDDSRMSKSKEIQAHTVVEREDISSTKLVFKIEVMFKSDVVQDQRHGHVWIVRPVIQVFNLDLQCFYY